MKLLLFCDRKATRFNIDKPFVRGGFRYATDGRIAVRLPTEEPDTTEGRYPEIAKLFEEFSECNQPFPEWKSEQMKCRECNGTSNGLVRCTTCDGGWHECSCGDDHECGRCKGTGDAPGEGTCLVCGGKGHCVVPAGQRASDDEPSVVELRGHHFDVWYLGLIQREFTNVRYVIADDVGGNDHMLCFAADGGIEGMLNYRTCE